MPSDRARHRRASCWRRSAPAGRLPYPARRRPACQTSAAPRRGGRGAPASSPGSAPGAGSCRRIRPGRGGTASPRPRCGRPGRRSARRAARRRRGNAGRRGTGAASPGRHRCGRRPAAPRRPAAAAAAASGPGAAATGTAVPRPANGRRVPRDWPSSNCAAWLSGSWRASCTASVRPAIRLATKACCSSSVIVRAGRRAHCRNCVAAVWASDWLMANRPTRKSPNTPGTERPGRPRRRSGSARDPLRRRRTAGRWRGEARGTALRICCICTHYFM